MKNILLLLSCLIISLSSFAQLKPEEGDFGLGFRLTGLANVGFFAPENTILTDARIYDPQNILVGSNVGQLLPQEMFHLKYYLSPETALRLSLGAGYINDKLTSDDDVNNTITERTLSTFSAGVNIGIEWHYASAAVKIDPYGGLQINSAYIYKIKRNVDVMNADETLISTETVTYPAGYGVGLHLFSGFNYFFTSNFALGAEMSIGFDRISMGGDWTWSQSDAAGNLLIDESGLYRNVNHSLRVGSTAGVNATVYF